jgi:hypothetical protein
VLSAAFPAAEPLQLGRSSCAAIALARLSSLPDSRSTTRWVSNPRPPKPMPHVTPRRRPRRRTPARAVPWTRPRRRRRPRPSDGQGRRLRPTPRSPTPDAMLEPDLGPPVERPAACVCRPGDRRGDPRGRRHVSTAGEAAGSPRSARPSPSRPTRIDVDATLTLRLRRRHRPRRLHGARPGPPGRRRRRARTARAPGARDARLQRAGQAGPGRGPPPSPVLEAGRTTATSSEPPVMDLRSRPARRRPSPSRPLPSARSRSATPTTPASRSQRRFTYRAIAGVSMGSGGAAYLGMKYHDSISTTWCPLGGLTDQPYILHYIAVSG